MLKKIIFLMIPLFIFANWNDVAMSGFNVIAASKGRDVQMYKSSLTDLIDKTGKAVTLSSKQDNSEFELKLPDELVLAAKNSKDPNAQRNLKKIRNLATPKLIKAVEPISGKLKQVVGDMSEHDASSIMANMGLLGPYLKKNAAGNIREILSPIAYDLTTDPEFNTAYESLMKNSKKKVDLNEYFTSGLVDEIFDALEVLNALSNGH